MTKNMGSADRAIRAVIGIVILGIGLSRGAWWGWLGLIPLVTAAVAWCPAYLPLRLSTCGKKTPTT